MSWWSTLRPVWRVALRPPKRRAAGAALGIAAALAVSILSGCATAPRRSPAAGPTLERTVFLVRHAEKQLDAGDDPGLTAAGRARSEALAELLAPAGVTHLFSSPLRRTRATLAPLAGATRLAIVEVAATDPEAQVRALRALPAGSVAVVAGHSNTLPRLAELLGTRIANLTTTAGGDWLGDDEYDRLFRLTLPLSPDQPARLVELRYGEAAGHD